MVDSSWSSLSPRRCPWSGRRKHGDPLTDGQQLSSYSGRCTVSYILPTAAPFVHYLHGKVSRKLYHRVRHSVTCRYKAQFHIVKRQCGGWRRLRCWRRKEEENRKINCDSKSLGNFIQLVKIPARKEEEKANVSGCRFCVLVYHSFYQCNWLLLLFSLPSSCCNNKVQQIFSPITANMRSKLHWYLPQSTRQVIYWCTYSVYTFSPTAINIAHMWVYTISFFVRFSVWLLFCTSSPVSSPFPTFSESAAPPQV